MKTNKELKLNTHTKYIAWVYDKLLHSTLNPCQAVMRITPDERWYLNSIPKTGNYKLCPDCFQEDKSPQND